MPSPVVVRVDVAPVPASGPSLRSNSALDIACSRHINQPKIEIKSNQTKVVWQTRMFFGPKQRLMICLCPGNGLPTRRRGCAASCSSFHFLFAFLWPPTQTVRCCLRFVSCQHKFGLIDFKFEHF